ncbi:MAG: hypothetical protein QOC82_34 [Frankiaceae bacterium]|nr:hypothetical protein [Frankiaceae bacterium]
MYRTIVVGTDGSATADKAVGVAGSLARATGADLHVVMAYRPARVTALAAAGAAGSAGIALPVPAWADDEQRDAAEAVLRRTGDRLSGDGVQATVVARFGEAADALLATAEELDADLIVVGNRGMNGVRRYLLGSVAGRVAHHARCSVHIAHTR